MIWTNFAPTRLCPLTVSSLSPLLPVQSSPRDGHFSQDPAEKECVANTSMIHCIVELPLNETAVYSTRISHGAATVNACACMYFNEQHR